MKLFFLSKVIFVSKYKSTIGKIYFTVETANCLIKA
jgi:hypothetical protein